MKLIKNDIFKKLVKQNVLYLSTNLKNLKMSKQKILEYFVRLREYIGIIPIYYNSRRQSKKVNTSLVTWKNN